MACYSQRHQTGRSFITSFTQYRTGKITGPLQNDWQRKRWGMPVGNSAGLRFADDILIVASSKEHVQRILEDLIEAAAAKVLPINRGETKVLSNAPQNLGCSMKPWGGGGVTIQVISYGGSAVYFGKSLSTESAQGADICARIEKA